MRLTKPVLFSLMLSLLAVPGSSSAPGDILNTNLEVEPGGPLTASATLVRVVEQAGALRALVRLDLISDATDAEATILSIDPEQAQRPGRRVGQASLSTGRHGILLLESELSAGRENHLLYRVVAHGRNGSRLETTAYLRVNLDPSLEPEEVGDCLQYQGAPGTEVQP